MRTMRDERLPCVADGAEGIFLRATLHVDAAAGECSKATASVRLLGGRKGQ